MPKLWLLYDYVNSGGRNDFAEWTRTLEKPIRAKLNAKLDVLQRLGPETPVVAGPLKNTSNRGTQIYKLRITANNVQLRPMTCKGPINLEAEYTLLLGCTERDDAYVPRDAVDRAELNRAAILKNKTRRCAHERIS